MDPDLIREGGTIPIARTFQDVIEKSIIMMPIGGFDDGLHSQNEKMSRFDSTGPLFLFHVQEVLNKAFISGRSEPLVLMQSDPLLIFHNLELK